MNSMIQLLNWAFEIEVFQVDYGIGRRSGFLDCHARQQDSQLANLLVLQPPVHRAVSRTGVHAEIRGGEPSRDHFFVFCPPALRHDRSRSVSAGGRRCSERLATIATKKPYMYREDRFFVARSRPSTTAAPWHRGLSR